MDKNTTRIVVIVTVIIIVAVVLLMINNAKSKKMEALIREAELRSIEREAEYNARKKDEPVTEIVSTAVNPPAEDAEDSEDVEIVGDQSLVLDEDPVSEYNEMADDSGISKIVPPQVDKNWVESRQVEPVKDLSVGIAIVNDVSKTENLQTGKTSSKYPIKQGTGIRAECADGKCGDPSKYPQPKPLGSVRRMDGTYSNIDAVRIAAKNAAQKRDAEIKRVLDEKVRSQAKSAAMKQREYVDTSRIKQYDVKPSKAPPTSLMRPTGPSFGSMRPTGPSFGSMRPAVMPPDHAMKIRQAAMKADRERMIEKNMKLDDDARKASQNASMKAMLQVKSPIRKISKNIDVATSIEASNIAKRMAMENAIKLEQADIKSLNETGFTVKETQKRAAMKIQQVAQDAREAAERAEREEKMKNVMKAQQVAMKAAEQAEKEKMRAAMEAQQAAMKAAEQAEKEKMQAAMEAQQAAMEAQQAEKEKIQAAMEAAEQDAMKAAADAENEEKMKAVQAAIAGIEGYEIMKPLGSMVY